jgi:PadR family transcriptional regulator PadR
MSSESPFKRRSARATTAVILALAEQPATWRYGHELCQQLDLQPGCLYRALMRLADLGLLEAAWESDAPADRPPRHRYRLSGPGRVHAAKLAAGHAGPGRAVAGLGLAGVAARVAFLGYYLAEYPAYRARSTAGTLGSLSPVTAAVLAVVLAGCAWLAVRPPGWLLGDHARRFGVGMAVALVGFVLTSRQELHVLPGDAGMMFYSVPSLILGVTGSAAAAAVGRSFRSGLWACARATVLGVPLLIAAWLAEALHWYQQGRGMLLDGEGGSGSAPTWAMRSGGPCPWACSAREHGDLAST